MSVNTFTVAVKVGTGLVLKAIRSCIESAKRYSGVAGVHTMRHLMSDKDGIDEVNGTVDVYRLCPNEGDSIMVVNCGTHFELRHHSWNKPVPFGLTEQDVDDLRQGLIIWN